MRWLHAGRQAVSARLQCVVTHIAGGAPIKCGADSPELLYRETNYQRRIMAHMIAYE